VLQGRCERSERLGGQGVSCMGRKWRNSEQFRPLFEVFLKKIGFWVVDVWECVAKNKYYKYNINLFT
jgi:hypothetical protein